MQRDSKRTSKNLLKSRFPKRTITEACGLAGIDFEPERPDFDTVAFADILLQLLVAGRDHNMTGTKSWQNIMLYCVPRDIGPWGGFVGR